MMGSDVVFAEALSQMVRHALRQAARIDEDQRGAVLLDQLDEAVVNLVPHFVGGDRAKLAARALRRRDRAGACGRC